MEMWWLQLANEKQNSHKNLFEKGQGLAIDMTIAMFILFLVLAGLLGVWTNNLEVINEEEIVRELNRKASQTMEVLIRTPGSPDNWDTLTITEVTSIGLASSDRVIDEDKLNTFKNFTANYDQVREKLKLGAFHYFFTMEGADDVNAGLSTTADAYAVTVSRIVNYKGEEASAKLTIYHIR